jgi:hypothetical protein
VETKRPEREEVTGRDAFDSTVGHFLAALHKAQCEVAPTAVADPVFSSVTPPATPREVFIQGITKDGRTFRPSDWAERLAGAMSSFRPGVVGGGPGAHIGYSPYCVPRLIHGIKCVIVNEALRDIEPMAWDFVMNFARDNSLQVCEACLLPDGTLAPAEQQHPPGP